MCSFFRIYIDSSFCLNLRLDREVFSYGYLFWVWVVVR